MKATNDIIVLVIIMFEELRDYIKNNLVREKSEAPKFRLFKSAVSSIQYDASVLNEEECVDRARFIGNTSLDSYIDKTRDDNKFQSLLFKLIDDRGLKDSDVYNKVHLDRRLFSKIRSEEGYHPSRETVILLGLALELNESEIETLLESASYSLPKNNYYDLIIRFCFVKGVYKINEVNELLDEYSCKLFSY